MSEQKDTKSEPFLGPRMRLFIWVLVTIVGAFVIGKLFGAL